jgi:polar amino acid transport system substrate-binding protein
VGHGRAGCLRDQFPPYQVPGAQAGQTPAGVDIDMASAIATQAGWPLLWRQLPWARQLVLLQNGELDLCLAASPTPERDAYAVFTEPYRDDLTALISLNPNASIASLEALRDKSVRIGYVRGSVIPGDFETARRDPAFASRLVPVRFSQEGLDLLRKRRIDYLADDWLTVQHLAGEGRVAQACVLHKGRLHLMLARHAVAAAPQLLTKFNEAIALLRANGRLRQLQRSLAGLS